MKDIVNFEIKARCVNADNIKNILLNANADYKGCDHQIDTYFETKQGRLKLRQGNVENSLIYYERSNNAESRESLIKLEKLNEESNIADILLTSLSVKKVVDKKRHIYFIENVKFHIDEVEELGNFIEIEAIDDSNKFSKDELKNQCDHWINEFRLKKKDFMNLSYSDFVGETFSERINREASKFLDELYIELGEKLHLYDNELDHLCYRVVSTDEYEKYKIEFSKIGKLLIESEVGGRPIATYKLATPIKWKNRLIDVIELPSPKAKNKYATGFEHAEFVIKESFDDYIQQHDKLDFDLAAINKDFNADIRLKLGNGASIKLHHQSLESVIEYEKSIG